MKMSLTMQQQSYIFDNPTLTIPFILTLLLSDIFLETLPRACKQPPTWGAEYTHFSSEKHTLFHHGLPFPAAQHVSLFFLCSKLSKHISTKIYCAMDFLSLFFKDSKPFLDGFIKVRSYRP
jgi:hypothetical protein